MSDDLGNTPPETTYTQPPPPPPGYAQAPTTDGLSDTAAGALAYVTIIPAIIFLVVAPYNTKPSVKFHSLQSIGLLVAWICLWIALVMVSLILAFIPFLHFLMLLIYPLAFIGFLVVWLLCILKASQGGSFKLPIIGDFAAKQSGYNV